MWRSYRRKAVHEELQADGGYKYEDLKEDFLSDTSQDDHALEDSFDSQFKHEIHVNPSPQHEKLKVQLWCYWNSDLETRGLSAR